MSEAEACVGEIEIGESGTYMVALIRRNGEPASGFAASVIETTCRPFSMLLLVLFCLGVEGISMSTSPETDVAAFLRFLEGSCSLFLCLRFLSGRAVSVDMLNLLDGVVELNDCLV